MSVLDTRAPARAPGVELLGELSGSGYDDSPSLVRRPDGQTVQVTPLLYRLLEVIDGERDLAQIADELGQRVGKVVAPEDVQYLLEKKLAPLGLLGEADGSAPTIEKSTPLLGLKPKFVVSDPKVTSRITRPFAWLFRRWMVVPVLLAFAVTCWWVLWEHGLASGTRQAFDSPGMLLAVFGLTLLSAGWHEFGHAAACRARGATPGAMGAGLYLVWPAFYTDVDDSYRLSRWGRLVVDLGGLYFNAIVAVAVAGVWLVTGLDALLLIVASQLLLMLRQLAPVIRADGYHILADLTGVPDLFQHIKPTLAGLLPQNWGKPQPQPLRRWARWVVRAWVLLIVPLLLWMLLAGVLLLPRLVATAWNGLQRQGSAFSENVGDGDVLGALAGILKMLALILPVAAVTYQLVRIGRRAGKAAITRTEARPAARAGVVVAAAALAALLGWAWWPSGQYQPVRADERGTLRSVTRVQAMRASSFRPIEGVRPQLAYALVPRKTLLASSRPDTESPALLLVRSPDGTMRSVLTGDDRTGVAFPFKLPADPRKGDNQALAVNSEDGSVVYDVAVALVWVKDGEVVDNRNEAYALASCTSCTTVAVAFQVVLVIGQSDVVTPINTAVAANGSCVECVTTALAIQLVVTLKEMPSEEVQEQIEAAIASLDGLEEMEDPYAEVKAVEQQILTLLVENGLVEEADVAAATGSTSPTTSPAPGSTTTLVTPIVVPVTTTSTTTKASTTTTAKPATTTSTTAPEETSETTTATTAP